MFIGHLAACLAGKRLAPRVPLTALLFGLLGWLFIPWAWWIERTRRTLRV
jgi:hypothetical protein